MAFERVTGALTGPSSGDQESGQTLVEYSLIIGLIAVAAIIGITMVAGGIDSLWSLIGDRAGNAIDSVL